MAFVLSQIPLLVKGERDPYGEMFHFNKNKSHFGMGKNSKGLHVFHPTWINEGFHRSEFAIEAELFSVSILQKKLDSDGHSP